MMDLVTDAARLQTPTDVLLLIAAIGIGVICLFIVSVAAMAAFDYVRSYLAGRWQDDVDFDAEEIDGE